MTVNVHVHNNDDEATYCTKKMHHNETLLRVGWANIVRRCCKNVLTQRKSLWLAYGRTCMGLWIMLKLPQRSGGFLEVCSYTLLPLLHIIFCTAVENKRNPFVLVGH